MADQSSTFVLSAAAAAIGFAVLHWTSYGPFAMIGAVMASAAIYLTLAALTRQTALIGLLTVVRTLRAKPETSEQ